MCVKTEPGLDEAQAASRWQNDVATWWWQAGGCACCAVCGHHSADAAAGRQTCAAKSERLRCGQRENLPRPGDKTAGVTSARI